VHEAVAILESLGHEVVKFEIPNILDFVYLYFDHMLGDSGITSLEIWEGEILDQVVSLVPVVIFLFRERLMSYPITYYPTLGPKSSPAHVDPVT
jgi:hypothetical protein